GMVLAPRPTPGRVAGSTVWRQVRQPAGGGSPAPDSRAAERRAESLTREEKDVLDAVAWQPTLLSQVVDRTGLPVGTASRALDSLEGTRRLGRDHHWWIRLANR